jgi:hypothetical protein
MIIGLISISSCKKTIEVGDPPNVLTPGKVFDNDAAATSATLGDYISLKTFDANFVAYVDQYVDELTQPTLNATSTEFANGTLSTSNGAVASIWQYLYITIYRANANIEGLSSAKSLTDSVKKQCMGEALFIRAYSFLNLVNIFGDVPLITTTDVQQTSITPRSPVAEIYNQIVTDLTQAETLLTTNYPTSDKIRANKWAAAALLARVYLYRKNWQQAELTSSSVIGSNSYQLSSISSMFYQNSTEAIWQLWNATGYTGLSMLVPASSGVPSYTISNNLLSVMESGDLRRTNWMKEITSGGKTYTSPYKYKLRTTTTGANAEYTMYLRLAEQYLIRAEARANLNSNLTGAIADLNVIRSRAGLNSLSSASNQSQILAAIVKERRVELFAEGGQRYFDLKRTGDLNNTMSQLKSTWNNLSSPLFPIPQAQRSINPSISQNPGY